MFKTRPKNLFVLSLLVSAPFLSAQSTAPRWYLDKEAQYPSRSFIASVGEGATRAAAETAAVAGVSLFFNTKTEVRNQAIREFNEAVVNNTTDFSKKTYINENAVIRSEQEFLGVRFADPYYDTRNKTWAALAFINRQEAAGVYDAKISANMSAINALASDAETETEPLYACGLLFRALNITALTSEYIKTSAVIDTASRTKYAPHLDKIQSISSRYRTLRDSISFSLTSNAPDTTGPLERSLQELLEKNGYVTTNKGLYTVSLRFTPTQETNDRGIFVRSGLVVRVERNNRALFSYSKNYPRYGHLTLEGAYNRVFLEIGKDLEENFIAKLNAMLGI
jgi:hypothetical protein